MALLDQWRDVAYDESANKGDLQRFWGDYFKKEQAIYKELLAAPDTEVSLRFDKELLYKNMVAADAEWLYGLEEWKEIFDEDKLKELYKEQKSSQTVVNAPKIYPNDPCPWGSGKKYKKCCGRR